MYSAFHAAAARSRYSGKKFPTPTAQARSGQELLPGSASYDRHPTLQCAAGDLHIVKYQSSPLHPRAATGLDAELRARGIDTVIITGLVTNGCCDCTARDAFQHGYKVIVASDATAAMSDEEHNAALLNLTIYYAYVAPSERIITALGAGMMRLPERSDLEVQASLL